MSTAPTPDQESLTQRFRRKRRKKVKKLGKKFIRRMSGFLGEQSTVGDPEVFEDSAPFPEIAALEAGWRTIRGDATTRS